MTSIKTAHIPYDYYYLPFCEPKGKKEYKPENLGKSLSSSLFHSMLTHAFHSWLVYCTLFCSYHHNVACGMMIACIFAFISPVSWLLYSMIYPHLADVNITTTPKLKNILCLAIKMNCWWAWAYFLNDVRPSMTSHPY